MRKTGSLSRDAAHRAQAPAPGRKFGRPGDATGPESRTDFRLTSPAVCKHCTHAGCLDVCRRVRLHRVWVLGWEPPISTVVRVAKRDCELGGIAIPEGTNVSVSVAAANRDPAHYPDPDWFDPTRKNFAHLMFGAGPHVCLGMPLARMETTVAINALLDRLPDLHLDPTAPEPVINGVTFRSPAALPVEFTPA